MPTLGQQTAQHLSSQDNGNWYPQSGQSSISGCPAILTRELDRGQTA